jgi:tripartite-type tricarboxylate transporter receptor subunit TctC
LIVALYIFALAGPALAQAWPERPLTMVVPFAVGSGTDVVGRVLAPRLSDLLGQHVIAENVGGAGGMTGAARVARATPDGYQFVLGTVATHAQNQSLYKHPLYNAVTDFEPVALIADVPLVLITRNDLHTTNLQEFIAYVKANQDKMQYGSAGAGSASHLACVLLNSVIGVNVTHVPYRGAAAAMQDLLAGRTDYQCPLLPAAIPQIQAHGVTPVAILAKTRSLNLPSLATAHEQGLADFETSAWHGIFLPKGTSEAIVQRLHDAIITTLETRSVQDELQRIGATPIAPERTTSTYLAKFLVSENDKWAAIIKASNIDPE